MAQRFDTPASVQESIRNSRKIRQRHQSRFDQQAASFDARAGVPREAAQAVAQELIQLTALTDGDVIVDIGAGTGSIGGFVVGTGVRYIALDVSFPMLQIFAAKLGAHPPRRSRALLIAADADMDWPLTSGSTTVLFFSRAVHLLQPAHVVQESLRIAHPGGAFFVIGRIRRSPESLRALLRKEMQRLLDRHGMRGKNGEEIHERLIAAFAAQGCHLQETGRRIVATWTVEESPRVSIDAWRGKEGLAGTLLSAPVQQEVLEELERWAKMQFGNLEQVRGAQEHYEMTVIEIAPRSQSGIKGEGAQS